MSTLVPDRRQGWLMLACFLVAEAAFVVVSVLVLLPFAVVATHAGAGVRLPGPALVAALLVPTVTAGIVGVVGAVLLGRGELSERLRSQLALRWQLSHLGIGLLFGVAGLVVTIPASLLWARWAGKSANSAVAEVFEGQRLSLALGLVLFVAVWLIAPMCEELLYRGLLWRALEYWRWNRWVIFTLTTVLFSLAHLELLRTPLLLVISLPIALARLLTGNLLASIVAHQANNLLPAVGLLLITQGAVPS